MAASEIATALEQTETSWRALRLFSGYRLFLASILFFVVYLQLPPDFLGKKYPALYQIISFSYLLLALILLIFSSWQWGVFVTQCSIQLLIDVLALALIIHASGGLQTGLGALLVVIVVAGERVGKYRCVVDDKERRPLTCSLAIPVRVCNMDL